MTNPLEVNWTNSDSHFFLNPRMPNENKQALTSLLQSHPLAGHIFLSTSGSTAVDSSELKWVALKKSAFLTSANSVNAHLGCTKADILLNTLPPFHVGGLALFARSYVSGAKLVNLYCENKRWSPHDFVKSLKEHKSTISSLVPTQIYDLVTENLSAPASLRFIVVGGGAISPTLYARAKQLQWPLLPSYGMTECCSQIATASPHFSWQNRFPEMTILPHLQLSLSAQGAIEISGESLLSGYILQTAGKTQYHDPKIDGKIMTSDQGALINNNVIIYGRADENIKINGENVSLVRLQELLEDTREKFSIVGDCAVVNLPHPRNGNQIVAVFTQAFKLEESFKKVLSDFNNQVFPYERIQKIFFLSEIPRTDLNKIKRKLVIEIINENYC